MRKVDLTMKEYNGYTIIENLVDAYGNKLRAATKIGCSVRQNEAFLWVHVVSTPTIDILQACATRGLDAILAMGILLGYTGWSNTHVLWKEKAHYMKSISVLRLKRQ
ncbi:MAG: hypothetical protein ACRC6X_02800 [Culicoidibacterales bacterium]